MVKIQVYSQFLCEVRNEHGNPENEYGIVVCITENSHEKKVLVGNSTVETETIQLGEAVLELIDEVLLAAKVRFNKNDNNVFIIE